MTRGRLEVPLHFCSRARLLQPATPTNQKLSVIFLCGKIFVLGVLRLKRMNFSIDGKTRYTVSNIVSG